MTKFTHYRTPNGRQHGKLPINVAFSADDLRPIELRVAL